MKTKILPIQSPVKVSYPCLMINKDKDLIVLMNSPGTGMLLYSGPTSNYKVGSYCVCWKIENFTPFEGIVEISP